MPTGYPDYNMNTWNPLDAGVCTFKEDFIAGIETDGSIGECGWRGSIIGVHGYLSTVEATWPNLGVMQIAGDITANNGIALFVRLWSQFGILGAHAPWDSLFVFKLAGALAKTRARVGWCDSNPSAMKPGQGMWLRYDKDAAFADTTLKLCVRHLSSEAEQIYDTGLAADTNFHTLRIRSLEAGVVRMTLDYGAEHSFGPAGCDVTVTLPTFGQTPMFICGTIDATLVVMHCDYAAFQSWGMGR